MSNRIAALCAACIFVLMTGYGAVDVASKAGLYAADPHASNSKVIRLPGLKSSAKVIRDVDGLAHVKARNEHDMFFLQGWTHAQDRLFQMDVNRRQPSGTLAELLGQGALPSDVQLRTIGLRRSAARTWAAIQAAADNGDDADNGDAVSEGVEVAMVAYAEGVNAFVDRAGGMLPPEYGVLGLSTFEP